MGKCLFLRKGETHTAPISGILANTLAVRSTVKLMENGTAAEYLVVHQGLPSSMYDASCDGTWLLRKDCYESRVWHIYNTNSYKDSTIHSYLNSTFLNLFDDNIRENIKMVKIPYVNGTASSTVASGANGLSAQIFLLSGYEVGWTNSTNVYFPVDGACLSYFSGLSATDSKRIGYINGGVIDWWLRSPYTKNSDSAWLVRANGNFASYGCTSSCCIRPALILPHTALFDKTTLILKGVA